MALIDVEMPLGFAPTAAEAARGRPVSQVDRRGAERVTAVSLARAGMLALLAMPWLLVASLIAATPLAFPAILAAGFLVVSWALRAGNRRTAHVFMAVILCGMIGAALSLTLLGSGAGARMASILVPLFAAAPAGLHLWEGRRRAPARPGNRLDESADIAGSSPRGSCGAELTADHLPAVRTPTPAQPASAALWQDAAPVCEAPAGAAGETSDAAEALGFALKLLGAEAERRSVRLVTSCDPGAAVRCERRALRRIIRVLAGEAVRSAEPGSEVNVSIRGLRGAVLLRVEPFEADSATEFRKRGAIGAGAGLVAEVDGTLLCESAAQGHRISVRLPRAAVGPASQDCQPQQVVGELS